MGGDRFIPTRNGNQMDVASFLLSKENDCLDPNNTAGKTVSYNLFWCICPDPLLYMKKYWHQRCVCFL